MFNKSNKICTNNDLKQSNKSELLKTRLDIDKYTTRSVEYLLNNKDNNTDDDCLDNSEDIQDFKQEIEQTKAKERSKKSFEKKITIFLICLFIAINVVIIGSMIYQKIKIQYLVTKTLDEKPLYTAELKEKLDEQILLVKDSTARYCSFEYSRPVYVGNLEDVLTEIDKIKKQLNVSIEMNNEDDVTLLKQKIEDAVNLVNELKNSPVDECKNIFNLFISNY